MGSVKLGSRGHKADFLDMLGSQGSWGRGHILEVLSTLGLGHNRLKATHEPPRRDLGRICRTSAFMA